jgi:hypothetical protein
MFTLFDSFDTYQTAQLAAHYLSVGGENLAVVPSQGRRGTNALQLTTETNGRGFISWSIEPEATVSLGFAYNANAGDNAGNCALFAFGNSGDNQSGGAILAVVNSGFGLNFHSPNYPEPLFGSTPAGFISVGEYHHYEFVITWATDSSGTIACYRDAGLFATVTCQTQACAHTPDIAVLGHPSSFGWDSGLLYYDVQGYFDDLYSADEQGSYNNSLPIGDCKVLLAFPNAAGHETDWTVTGETYNWQAVSQDPPLDDDSYVSTATSGTSDAYIVSTLASTYTEVLAVANKTRARKTDSGNRQLALGVSDGTTDAFGSGQGLGTSYEQLVEYFQSNPITAAAWEPSDITGLQAAINLAA